MAHVRFVLFGITIAVGFFLAQIAAFELGRRLGKRHREWLETEKGLLAGNGDLAVFSLLSLLLGFSFSGAAGRFEQRRDMVRQEVNAISTAWLLIQTLPEPVRPAIENGFRRYLDAVIAAYEATTHAEEAKWRMTAVRIGNEVWAIAVSASLDPSGEKARMLLLPAINEMFDAVESEWLARRMHPPSVIYGLLGGMALIGAIFVGIGQSGLPGRNWSFIVGAAAVLAITMYVIIDLEYPRLGLVRIDPFDQALVELRQTMNGP